MKFDLIIAKMTPKPANVLNTILDNCKLNGLRLVLENEDCLGF